MSLATPTVLSEGQVMDPTFRLLSLEVQREIQRIPWAELRLIDGDVAAKKFPVTDSDFFAPGKEIELKLRYEGKGGEDVTVFKGVVVRKTVETHSAGATLVVGLKDPAVKLTGSRHSAVFRDRTDHEVIADLVQGAGLEAGPMVKDTEPKHRELVQYHCTDWDFILSRAEAQGLWVLVVDGKVGLHRPDPGAAPDRVLEWGTSILGFEMDASAEHPFAAVQSVAWNPKAQTLTPPAEAKDFQSSQGAFDVDGIAERLGTASRRLSHPVPMSPEELAPWARGSLTRSRLAMLRGRIAVPGNGAFQVLQTVELDGFGAHWQGKAQITGLRHRLDGGGWRTDLQFGVDPEAFSERQKIRDAPAAGLLPAVRGPQIGVVAPHEDDPEQEFRLKVLLPGIHEEEGHVWARLAVPDAGPARGFWGRPQPGDEVVLGFLSDDPRHPVILGSLYSSKNAPPKVLSGADGKDRVLGLVTPKGTALTFTDADQAKVELSTKAGKRILVDDREGKLEVADEHGSSILLTRDGVVIKSAKDLKIEAPGQVTIQGARVDVK